MTAEQATDSMDRSVEEVLRLFVRQSRRRVWRRKLGEAKFLLEGLAELALEAIAEFLSK